MVARITITPGQVFNSLTVLREVDRLKTGQVFKRAVEVECICGHIFVVRYNAIKTGVTTSCGCQKSRYVTDSNRAMKVQEVLSDKDIMRVDDSLIISGKHKLTLMCKVCEYEFQRGFDQVVSKPVVCKQCLKVSNAIITEQEYLLKIEGRLKVTSQHLIGKEYDKPLQYKDNLIVGCNICSKNIKRRLECLLHEKSGCPCQTVYGFDPTQKAYLYLINLKDIDGNTVAYKYGITNYLDQRLSMIKRKYSGHIELLYHWEYDIGQFAKEHESFFKKNYKSSVSKEVMKDGWTETFNKEFLSSFILLQNNQYKSLETDYGF